MTDWRLDIPPAFQGDRERFMAWHKEMIAYKHQCLARRQQGQHHFKPDDLAEMNAETRQNIAWLQKSLALNKAQLAAERRTSEAIIDMCQVCPGPSENTVVCKGCTK